MTKRIKITGSERALEYALERVEKWEGAQAVIFMYSPGKGMGKRKGWVVAATCSS
jgi:hypothetical protein